LYMLIGQLVAVSWATALFWAVWETSAPPPPWEKKTNVVHASRRLVWTTITAALTSFSLYYAVLPVTAPGCAFPALPSTGGIDGGKTIDYLNTSIVCH